LTALVEDENPFEIVFGDKLLLDHFVGFRKHVAHVGDVEVADIGAEHHVEPGFERIAPGFETRMR